MKKNIYLCRQKLKTTKMKKTKNNSFLTNQRVPWSTLHIIVLYVLTGCCSQQTSNSVLCPKLDSLLTQYIKMNTNNYRVIQLTFMEYGGIDFVMFNDRPDYDSRFIDGYFFKQGKLITYYSFDYKDRSSYIDFSQTRAFKDSISGYFDEAPKEDGPIVMSNYENPYPKLYQLRSPQNIIERESIMIEDVKWDVAKGENAINCKELNMAINNYINRYWHRIYVVRFSEYDNHHYVSINGTFAYDPNMIDAYFFRNGHLVVLYDISHIPSLDYLKEKEIRSFKNSISNYRSAELYPEFMNISRPEKYEIISIEKLRRVPDSNPFWLGI